eukprot:CAMPEP_0201503872 /NCGR_PEP_ID=MMETSP0151_2-20130828/84901_1 /ASSEMBLY_ACC=CAM_ASM_000257 /TAXON_ID=200890 /ORGANISM="Paramoeba atlantica, Strain 621/1 / CCAP 1560/9" /LENGTH=127 /DNA_ID=CAMNT_0047897569 /DNA_START=1643 /DNA_END=2024 /DNA_ORIENTATION=+
MGDVLELIRKFFPNDTKLTSYTSHSPPRHWFNLAYFGKRGLELLISVGKYISVGYKREIAKILVDLAPSVAVPDEKVVEISGLMKSRIPYNFASEEEDEDEGEREGKNFEADKQQSGGGEEEEEEEE